jgi:hypothetical protein
LGSDYGDHPLDRGFDEWIGFYGGGIEYHYELAQVKAGRNDHKLNTIYEGKQRYRKRWAHTAGSDRRR